MGAGLGTPDPAWTPLGAAMAQASLPGEGSQKPPDSYPSILSYLRSVFDLSSYPRGRQGQEKPGMIHFSENRGGKKMRPAESSEAGTRTLSELQALGSRPRCAPGLSACLGPRFLIHYVGKILRSLKTSQVVVENVEEFSKCGSQGSSRQ